jgi:hypothetical protein
MIRPAAPLSIRDVRPRCQYELIGSIEVYQLTALWLFDCLDFAVVRSYTLLDRQLITCDR